eukprot:CAMPEP_0113881666 /NCGR_PEP_ID=MMETSP0780_2-20120614/8508_1 /TAXON_ID=652834 /ORGANISM="Palpitomonas bilix" /LENGTH=132 /DNA_ID=CAMNT_0000868559 /DNA_START=24 /DNA_END=419 /DNA_ORIENTATION=- /assembly_acc=CAM_ASM_000599
MGHNASKVDVPEFTGVYQKYSTADARAGRHSDQSDADTILDRHYHDSKIQTLAHHQSAETDEVDARSYVDLDLKFWPSTLSVEKKSLLLSVALSTVGAYAVFDTPFGSRRLVYADYTASGRALGLVEDYIKN